MEHRKLDALMTPVERIARVAAAGLTSATSSVTKPSGAKSYDNADGTRTIIGNVANGESNPSYTMATHVGDTTAPGTPTGVTASSKSGVVVVEWDGTLSGGIPDDFYAVRVYLDGSELGILTGAGSVSSASLDGGTTHSVTATAEDDACLPDGTPAHNVSAPTAAISVTVSEDAESVATVAQDALDAANATGQHFWSDSDGIHVTEATQEDWNDPNSSDYHSGANVLINALGQLFRDGLNNLLAVLPTGIAIYDGNGNAQTNIVASLLNSGIRLGNSNSCHVDITSNTLLITPSSDTASPVIIGSSDTDAGKTEVSADYIEGQESLSTAGSILGNLLNIGGTKSISGVNFGFSSATTNANGITTFNPNLGTVPTAVFVTAGKASSETEAVAKIAVPMVWSIDSATQVQVRWQRSDTNAWLASNAVGYYWLAIC